MSSTPQKQPAASTATSVCCAPATVERVTLFSSFISVLPSHHTRSQPTRPEPGCAPLERHTCSRKRKRVEIPEHSLSVENGQPSGKVATGSRYCSARDL